MKKSILFYVLFSIGLSTAVFAQSQFDKFEDIEGVTSVIVNQKAFSLMSKIGSESDEEYLDLIKNIETLKVFATEDKSVAAQMSGEVDKYLKTANLEELMRVKDGDDRVNIYVKQGKSEDFVKELFMFVKSGEVFHIFDQGRAKRQPKRLAVLNAHQIHCRKRLGRFGE